MSPIVAYLLGIITVLIIFLPFWYIAKGNQKVKKVYNDVFCKNIA
jgi:hypothetical protein